MAKSVANMHPYCTISNTTHYTLIGATTGKVEFIQPRSTILEQY